MRSVTEVSEAHRNTDLSQRPVVLSDIDAQDKMHAQASKESVSGRLTREDRVAW